MSSSDSRATRSALTFAWIAAALIGAYWALGGTGLLGAIGDSIEHDARTGGALIWGLAVLGQPSPESPVRLAAFVVRAASKRI